MSQLGRLRALVAVVVFVETLFYTAITPLLPHYVAVLHLSKSGAGVLIAAYAGGVLLTSVPAGAFASRVGVKPAVVLGLVLMSAATLVFGLGRSEAVLDSARFVQGIGGSLIWAGGLGWLTAAAPPQRRAGALGAAFAAAVAGAMFGPAVGAVASRVGTHLAFSVASVAGGCLIVATLTVHEPPRGERGSPSLRRAAGLLADVGFDAGLWLTAIAGLAFGSVNVLAPLRLHHLGAGAFVIGGAFLAAAAIEAAASPMIGRLADHSGRRLPVTVAAAAAIVVSVLLPFAAPAAALVALLVAGIPFYGALYVPAAALVSDAAQRQGLHQALGFGLFNLAWAGGQAVGSAGAGALAQAAGDASPFAVLAAGFALTLGALSPPGRKGILRLLQARTRGASGAGAHP